MITGKDQFWVFTLNNYTQENLKHLEEIECGMDKDVRAIKYQGEIAPRTGTKHLQGFIIFNKQQRNKTVITTLKTNSIHIAPMDKSIKTNLNYTEKSESYDKEANIFVTKGVFDVKQGKKHSLQQILDNIK